MNVRARARLAGWVLCCACGSPPLPHNGTASRAFSVRDKAEERTYMTLRNDGCGAEPTDRGWQEYCTTALRCSVSVPTSLPRPLRIPVLFALSLFSRSSPFDSCSRACASSSPRTTTLFAPILLLRCTLCSSCSLHPFRLSCALMFASIVGMVPAARYPPHVGLLLASQAACRGAPRPLARLLAARRRRLLRHSTWLCTLCTARL